MNRETWKNSLEGIGIGAIIASLLFVAMELRQSNQLGRLEALESMASEWNSTGLALADSDVLPSLLVKLNAGEDPSGFNDIENHRIKNVLFGLDHHWELRHRQLQLGVLEPDDYSFPRIGNGMYDSNYHRAIWPELRDSLSDDFAVFWEERFNLGAQ